MKRAIYIFLFLFFHLVAPAILLHAGHLSKPFIDLVKNRTDHEGPVVKKDSFLFLPSFQIPG